MPTAQTIDAETLQEAADDGVIALVRATKAEISNPGTRSESVRVEAEIVSSLRGPTPRPLVLRRYTSGGDTVLTPGRHYIVAAITDARFAPAMQVTGLVPVAEGQQDPAVAAHRAILERK